MGRFLLAFSPKLVWYRLSPSQAGELTKAAWRIMSGAAVPSCPRSQQMQGVQVTEEKERQAQVWPRDQSQGGGFVRPHAEGGRG